MYLFQRTGVQWINGIGCFDRYTYGIIAWEPDSKYNTTLRNL